MKRRCGTCRHFSSENDAASGCCLHPERANPGLVVTIRASELNCRSGWDKDLWEERPVSTVAGDHLVASGDAVAQAPALGDLAIPVESARRGGEDDGVDLLVNVAPSHRGTSRHASPGLPPPAASAPADPNGDLGDTRQLIRRAHDVHRLRLANRTRTAVAPALSDANLDTAASAPSANLPEPATVDRAPSEGSSGQNQQWAARMAELGPVPPVPVSEMRSDLLGWGANRQEAAERFESVPALDPSFRLPFVERPPAASLHAGFDEFDLPTAMDGDREPRSHDHEPPSVDLDRLAARRPPDAASSAHWFAPSHFDVDEPDGVDDFHDRLALAFALPDDSVDDRGSRMLVDRLDAGEDVHLGAGDGLAGEGDDRTADWLPYDDPFATAPRCCRTCRDFRPAEGGERGWCTSAWAFQHRRMVHADELACFSAIGIWWLPSDSLWLDDLDFGHAEPTPLVDAMVARRAAVDRMPQRERRRGRR